MNLHEIRRAHGDRGAALVEFALIFPIFMSLILGMVSAGLAYNRKLDMTHATREGARYGAALADDEVFTAPATWATTIRDVVVARSAGDLKIDQICVALVSGTGVGTATTTDFVWKGSNSGAVVGSTAGRYNDGTTDASQHRVQVLSRRPDRIQALVVGWNVTLSTRATSQHESDL